MAQWNLSVDLRGQGRSLAQTLRENATHARTLGAAVRRTQGDIRTLGTTSAATATRVRGLGRAANDAASRLNRLAAQTGRSAAGMRRLGAEIRTVERRLAAIDDDIRVAIRIDDHTGGATPALREVQEAAQDTARVLRTLRGRTAASAAAFDDLRNRALLAAGGLRSFNTTAHTADRRMEALGTRTRTLNEATSNLDDTFSRLTGRLGSLRGSYGSVNASTGQATARTRQLLIVAGMLGTALLPIAAAAAPIAAGLGAAGVAAGAFGIAIAGQIKALTDAVEAQTKYDDAVREHGRTSPEAAKAELEQIKLLKEMPPATRETAAAYAALTDHYKDWSNALAGDTMPAATKALGIFSAVLDKTGPMAKGASREVNRFMSIVAGGLQTDTFAEFMDDFSVFAVETLARANSGLVRFGRAMQSGEIGGNLREFLDYARANGPAVADTLGELVRVLLKLLAAGADVGVSMLTVVNAIAQLVNAIPTSVLSTLLQLAFAFKAVQLAGMALGAVGPVMATLATNTTRFVRAARFGGVASAIAGVTQQLTLMQRASIVLAALTLTVMAIDKLADEAKGAPPDVDKLTTSLKNLGEAGKFTGELQKTFGDMKGLVRSLGELKAQEKGLETVQGLLDFTPGGGGIEWLGTKVTEITNGAKSLSALQDDFKGLDQSMASLATSGHADLAADRFKQFTAALTQAGYSTKDIAAIFPEYQAAVAGLKAEQDLTARSMGLFGQQALATKTKLDAQKASADGLRASIQALNDVNRAALGGQIAFEQAIDDAAEAAKKNAGALTMTGGHLDLNSQKARDAATALQELGAKTDEATAAAREANAPWSQVIATYERGRDQFIKSAMAMGLNRSQAALLAQQVLDIPDEKSTRIEMDRADALAGLDEVIAKIQATPGAKSVTVSALTKDAMALLGDLGYTTEKLPNGEIQVTAKTGQALQGLAAVKAARDALEDRSITITTYRKTVIENTVQRPQQGEGNLSKYADGGIVRAAEGLFVPGYAPRQDTVSALLSPGEGVLVPETVRKLGATTGLGGPGIIKALNAWGRYGTAMGTGMLAFADGGTVPQRFATGGVTDFRYAVPQSGGLFSPSDAGQAAHRTKKVKVKGKVQEVEFFDLGALERKLKQSSAQMRWWQGDLAIVAERAGTDVAQALASMGADGVSLTKKMAHGSTKYLNEMAGALRGLAATAKVSLTDYTRSLSAATATDSKFAQNLATLAARGYGDLARQLAAQGDDTAFSLAASAVADNRKAGSANAAAKKANSQLTGEQVQQLVAVIAAISSSKTGLHDVAESTGLGEDDIIDIATKASAQIRSSLGSRATKFLADLARAQKGLSYANGGIRPGIYATTAGAVTFAEPSTGGEAYVPLGAHKRRQALPVLAEAARRHGVGLTDLRGSQQVVVLKDAGDTNITVSTLRTGATARDIAAEIDFQQRRARRGGVAARD